MIKEDKLDEDLLELVDHLEENYEFGVFTSMSKLAELLNDLSSHYMEQGSEEAETGYNMDDTLPISIE